MSQSSAPIASPITVHLLGAQAERAAEWQAFLTDSDNGHLFHDLNFLAYHPADRFTTHHLLFQDGQRLVALLPAAIVPGGDGRPVLKSPYGASVGGLVLPAGQAATTTQAVVEALQRHATDVGVSAVELRLAPNIYASQPNDSLGFTLAASGFALVRRWLTHAIPLPSQPGDALRLLGSRRRSYAHSATRQGAVVGVGGVEDLPAFYDLLTRNRARHGARPTHTLGELQRIFELVPKRVQLFTCLAQGTLIAGSIVFELNERVAYSFYPCHDAQFESFRPSTALAVGVANHYISRAFKYLDLGPSSFDDYSLNPGLARFKEEIGAVAFCRDTWQWQLPAADEAVPATRTSERR